MKAKCLLGIVGVSLLTLTGCEQITKSDSPTNHPSTAMVPGTHHASMNGTAAAYRTATNASIPDATMRGANDAKANERVYVFTQPMLATIYAVQYLNQGGPIFVPAEIQQKVKEYAPLVSMDMLHYAPASEQSVDAALIKMIQGHLDKPQYEMELVQALPGFELEMAHFPSGTRSYWYPINDTWPQWVNPTIR